MASLENALVGAVSSGLANLVVYPLDLAKTVIQTQLKQGDGELRVTPELIENGEESAEARQKRTRIQRLRPSPETKVESLERRYKHALDVIVKVYREEGFTGLYHGLSASLLGSFIQS